MDHTHSNRNSVWTIVHSTVCQTDPIGITGISNDSKIYLLSIYLSATAKNLRKYSLIPWLQNLIQTQPPSNHYTFIYRKTVKTDFSTSAKNLFFFLSRFSYLGFDGWSLSILHHIQHPCSNLQKTWQWGRNCSFFELFCCSLHCWSSVFIHLKVSENVLLDMRREQDQSCRESDYRAYWFSRNERILDRLLFDGSSIICLQVSSLLSLFKSMLELE